MSNLKIYMSTIKAMGRLVFKGERDKNPVMMSIAEYLLENKSELPINFIELIFASELNVIGMNHIESVAKRIGKYLKHNENMDDYIQLTRFIDGDGIDRINCDWCSIANGFSEFCVATVKNNKGIDIFLSSGPWFYASYYEAKLISKLPKSCFAGYVDCSDDEVEKFIVDNQITFDNVIEKMLASFYIKRMITFMRIVAQVEKRWCPFGYMQDMAYERNYHGTDLEAVVKELREFGKVVCTSCVSKLNETHSVDGAKESIYKDFVFKIKQYAGA